jgi:outer membrane protein assembly factor BamA
MPIYTKNIFLQILLLVSVFFLNTRIVFAQDTSDCQQKNLMEVLSHKKGAPAKIKTKRTSIVLLPVIGSSPATGAFIGVGGLAIFSLSKEATTRFSSANLSIQQTTKGQSIFMLKTNMYTKENLFFLQGDIRYLLFSQPTYGLGTNSPDTTTVVYQNNLNGTGTNSTAGAQAMEYNYLKLHQIISRRINKTNTLFFGGGYHLDYHYAIDDEDLDVANGKFTDHYLYCKKHNFDTSSYLLSGLSANFVIDTRDNLINPYKGYFVNINMRFNETFLGSSQMSRILWAEFRHYIPLSKHKARNVLAIWAWGQFQVAGNAPYMDLPAIGYDNKGFSGRGYSQGRFRGEQMVYGEVEWRFPISQCSQVLGGVIFCNFTSASNLDDNVYLFQHIRPGIGGGFRIMLDKTVRTNLSIDFARGKNSQGFYMTAGEIF